MKYLYWIEVRDSGYTIYRKDEQGKQDKKFLLVVKNGQYWQLELLADLVQQANSAIKP